MFAQRAASSSNVQQLCRNHNSRNAGLFPHEDYCDYYYECDNNGEFITTKSSKTEWKINKIFKFYSEIKEKQFWKVVQTDWLLPGLSEGLLVTVIMDIGLVVLMELEWWDNTRLAPKTVIGNSESFLMRPAAPGECICTQKVMMCSFLTKKLNLLDFVASAREFWMVLVNLLSCNQNPFLIPKLDESYAKPIELFAKKMPLHFPTPFSKLKFQTDL